MTSVALQEELDSIVSYDDISPQHVQMASHDRVGVVLIHWRHSLSDRASVLQCNGGCGACLTSPHARFDDYSFGIVSNSILITGLVRLK